MNCKNCGTQLVPGQIVCSNCDLINENDSTISNNNINENNFNNNLNYDNMNENNFNNNLNYDNVNENNFNNNLNYNDMNEKSIGNKQRKQHVIFKISSILMLIVSLALFFTQGMNVFITSALTGINLKTILGLVLAVVMLFASFFVSNYNIGKSSFFDNKIIFILLLIPTLIIAISAKIYFVILILNIIGFVITSKNEENY